MAVWYGRRYFRSAFPTEFDHRVKGRKKALAKLLKNKAQSISGIYFRLNTLRELGAGEDYSVSIYLTVRPNHWAVQSVREAATAFATELETLIAGCEDVKVDVCETLPTTEIDLHTIEASMRFDSFDFLSAAEESEENSSA